MRVEFIYRKKIDGLWLRLGGVEVTHRYDSGFSRMTFMSHADAGRLWASL
jgi:hypothetical protein